MATLKIDLVVDDKGSIVVQKFSGDAARSLDVAGSAAERFSKQMAMGGAAVAGLAAAVGTSLVVIGGKGLQVFADLEKRMIGVQKTTDFTAAEMKVFESSITGMARRVPVATAALLDIAGVAGQLGIKGVGNVTKFTEVVGKLSLATDVVGAEGAASIARLLNVTGEGVDTVDSFGAVLVALGNNSAATESQILDLATEIGLATSVFSVTSADALALGAAMKSIGVNAELGGSVVGRAMRTIEASIAKGGGEITKLSQVTGIAEKDLKKAFGDNATAVFSQWLQGIGRMIAGGTTAAEALKSFGLEGEEVLKVLPTMAVNFGVVEKSLKISNEELKKGTALNIEAAKAGESLSAQWDVVQNIATEMGSSIGGALAPSVKALIADFREWWDVNDKIVTQDIAGHIRELATVVSDNKESIISLFNGITEGAALAVEGVAKVVEAWKTLYNYSDANVKGLSLNRVLQMTPGEVDQYLQELNTGVSQIKEKIRQTQDEISQISKVRSFEIDQNGWSEKAEANYQKLLDKERELTSELGNQQRAATAAREANTTYKDSWLVLSELQITTAKAVSDAEDHAANQKALLAAKLTEEQKRQAEQQKKMSEEMVDYVKQQTLSEYEYKKWALTQDVAERRKNADGKKDLLDQITDYEVQKLKEIEEKRGESLRKDIQEWREATAGKIEMMNAMVRAQQTTTDTFVKLEELKAQGNRDTLKDISKTTHDELTIMQQEWVNFGHTTTYTFAGVIGDGLRGEFDSIGDAWHSLTSSMGNAFINMVANIAAQNLGEAVFGSFDGKGKPSGDGWLDTGLDWLGDWWEDTDFDFDWGGGGGESSWWDDADWFADGGNHGGGLRVVGERGPELEFTGPSTILSNKDSKAWLASLIGGSNFLTAEFQRLSRVMQLSGVIIRGATDNALDLNDAHADNRDATRDNTQATEASTKAEKANTEARSASTEKSSFTPGGVVTGILGYGLDKVTDAFLGPLAPVKDMLMSLTTIDEQITAAIATSINSAFGYSSAVSEALQAAAENAFGDVSGMLGTAAGDLSSSGFGLSGASVGLSSSGYGLSDSAVGLSDSASVLGTAAAGAFGSTSLGAEMTQTAAMALTSSAVALGSAAGSLSSGGNAGGFLGDTDIDSSDRHDDSTPGGIMGDTGSGGSGGSGSTGGSSTGSDNGTSSGTGGDQGGDSTDHAKGGWLGAHPGGGMINDGSGAADDVFLGMSGGAAHWGMRDEYVINQRSTAKYFPLLEAINEDRLKGFGHAAGGQIGGLDRYTMDFLSRPSNIDLTGRSDSFGGDEFSGDSMAELIDEIRQMRSDMNTRLTAIAANTNKTLSIVRRWEGKGMPVRP